MVLYFCSKQRRNAAAKRSTPTLKVMQQYDDEMSKILEDVLAAPPPSPPHVKMEEGLDQSVLNIAAPSHEAFQVKQHVAKRIETEKASILEQELELERYQKEADEKIQNLKQKIRTCKLKVEMWEELLDD